MDKTENILDKIQEILGNQDKNLNILEDQIDIDVQMEYFEYSQKTNMDLSENDIISRKKNLYEKNISDEDKKLLMVQLASLGTVEAFRILEENKEKQKSHLFEWARLAYQESRLLLERQLLDENQVLITTGLGGKGTKLRYFAVLISKTGEPFTDFQTEIVKKEIDFAFKENDVEIEKVSFEKSCCCLLVLIPLQTTIQDLFSGIIDECNQMGDFLYTNYIITNIRILSYKEVREFINAHRDELY